MLDNTHSSMCSMCAMSADVLDNILDELGHIGDVSSNTAIMTSQWREVL